MKNLSTKQIESGYKLEGALASKSVVFINYWLGHFILKVRAISGKESVLIVYTNFTVGCYEV